MKTENQLKKSFEKVNDQEIEKTDVVKPEEKSKEKSKTDRKADFEKLINEDYKDLFNEKLKKIVSKITKENEMLKNKMKKADEILDIIADRYGADSDDVDMLKKAVNSDNSLFADKADKYGMDVENYRYMKNLERENRSLKKELEYGKMEYRMADRVRKLYNDSKDLTNEYPEFDITEEIDNPEFIKLIQNGIDLKTAYEIVHRDEIMKRFKEKTIEDLKNEIRARENRPVENGLSSSSSAILKTDISKLTPAQRAEIAKRVQRGEKIIF